MACRCRPTARRCARCSPAVRLKRREALISSVLSASIDGIVVFGRDGVVQDANDSSAKLLGRSIDELHGCDVQQLLPGMPDVDTLDRSSNLNALGGRSVFGDHFELMVGPEDDQVPVEVSITRVAMGERVWFTAILRDMTERKKQQALLTHQATHDALTGLPNRLLLSRALDGLSSSTPTALFMLDLDRFKDVNDTLGHATGDAVLTILGQRLRGALSEQNLIARIGGDEFAVVIPHYTDITDLRALADDLLERVRAPIRTGANMIEVGASIGVALCPEHGVDGGALLQRADVAMYVAKNNRTNVEFYSAEADHSSIRHLKITGALRGAIANDELEIYYQPKVRLSDLKCIGVEALARWNQRRARQRVAGRVRAARGRVGSDRAVDALVRAARAEGRRGVARGRARSQPCGEPVGAAFARPGVRGGAAARDSAARYRSELASNSKSPKPR